MEKWYLFPRVITAFKWDLQSDHIYEPSTVSVWYFIKSYAEWEDGGLDEELFRNNENGFHPYECSVLRL